MYVGLSRNSKNFRGKTPGPPAVGGLVGFWEGEKRVGAGVGRTGAEWERGTGGGGADWGREVRGGSTLPPILEILATPL